MSDTTTPTIGCKVETYASREDWLASRSESIGASEVAAAAWHRTKFNPPPFSTPYEAWGRKVGCLPGVEETASMRAGSVLEPAIIRLLGIETGWEVQGAADYLGAPLGDEATLRHPTQDWITATPDAFVNHPDHGWIPAEVKLSSEHAPGDWTKAKPPLSYLFQVQWQLLVTGAPAGVLAALVGSTLYHYTIERDDEVIAALYTDAAWLWDLVCQARPIWDGMDDGPERDLALSKIEDTFPLDERDLEAVRSRYSRRAVEHELQGSGASAAAEEFIQGKAMEKAGAKLAKAAQARILAAAKGAEVIVSGGRMILKQSANGAWRSNTNAIDEAVERIESEQSQQQESAA
jgi:predicted phage-related endonuclease